MKILILVSLLVTSLAQAGQIVVYDSFVNQGTSFLNGEFAINESAGRAWVVISTSQDYAEGLPDTFRVPVKEMSFDITTQEVVISDSTGRTVCAFQKTGIFGKTIKSTRSCIFKSAFYTEIYDDGFETGKRLKLKVTLNY